MIDRATDDSDSWREKYLKALDAQQAQEARAQYQQLRRALVQLSIVADGQDPQLDEVLERLRHSLRSEDGPKQLPEVAEALNQQVREFEHNREQINSGIVTALSQVVAQLQQLGPSRPLKRELSHYSARLPLRSERFHLFPALLDQLAELQQQALVELKDDKPGLLGRLRGERAEMASEPLEQDINQVLQGVVAAINSEYMGEDALQPMVQRLQQGVPLRELPSVLEELRELVMRSWLSANQVFAGYLNSVNNELESISRVLGGVVDSSNRRQSAEQSLRDDLQQQCASLAESVDKARDLKQLKTRVSSQLGQIRAALTQFFKVGEEGELLAGHGQLEQLADRIKLMEREAEENRASLRRHRHKALHDPLTQLPNREAYDERLAHEVQRWQRYGHPLTLAVCDVDHFKQINDRFGHQAGDRVLKVISRAIGERLRDVDFFGRYGGEEFVILMPETGVQDALKVLDAVRQSLSETAFHYRKEPLSVTISMGLSEFVEGDKGAEVFGRADTALYSAKAGGRNRCVIG